MSWDRDWLFVIFGMLLRGGSVGSLVLLFVCFGL